MLCEKYMVVRMDDHGTLYFVADGMTADEAEDCVTGFKGHKQTYLKFAYTSKTRSKVISDQGIVE